MALVYQTQVLDLVIFRVAPKLSEVKHIHDFRGQTYPWLHLFLTSHFFLLDQMSVYIFLPHKNECGEAVIGLA